MANLIVYMGLDKVLKRQYGARMTFMNEWQTKTAGRQGAAPPCLSNDQRSSTSWVGLPNRVPAESGNCCRSKTAVCHSQERATRPIPIWNQDTSC